MYGWRHVIKVPGDPTRGLSEANPVDEIETLAGFQQSETAPLAGVEALERLIDASSRLWRTGSLCAGLEEMLAATIELLGAEMGNVQLLDEASGKLKIAAYRGFEAEFLEFFQEVAAEDDSACGRALRSRRRIIIEDVEQDPRFASSLPVVGRAGFRAVQSTPLLDRDGKVLGMLSTHFRSPHRPSKLDLQQLDLYARRASDFIERCGREKELRQRAEELEESEEFNRAIIESSPDCVKVLDLEGRLLMINKSGRRLLEIDDDAPLLGRDWRVLWPWVAARDGLDILAEAKMGRACRFEEFHPSFKGTWKWWDVIITPVRGSKGDIVRILSVSRDITDRKQAEDALREADRRKDEFLATLAHELRNPLAPIANTIYILRKVQRDGADANERASVLLAMAESQVNHLVRLVDDLLEVSRITCGKIKLKRQRTDLAAVLGQALETSQPLMAAARHEVSVVPGESLLIVDGDPIQLVQVFTNLLNNAAKYTPPAGRIDVSMQRIGDTAVVRVRDTGVGIPQEMLSRVFELFTQVDRNLGRSQGGIGVGLALARQLLELHGGDIEARSEGVGMGSEFLVRLPLATGPAELDGRPPAPQALSDPAALGVLVVDDDLAVANSFVMLLETLGVNARVAYGGGEALPLVAEFKPDLAFIDVGMPGMDGYETARKIRELSEGGKPVLVALSGWGRAEDRRRSGEAGFDHHFVKPIDVVM